MLDDLLFTSACKIDFKVLAEIRLRYFGVVFHTVSAYDFTVAFKLRLDKL